MRSLFHLSFHVRDLASTRLFYGEVLGCTEGRSAASWVDFNFFGHQLSMHLGEPFTSADTGQVGGHQVPMPHFGVLLPLAEWQALSQRLRERGVAFVMAPQLRFEGLPGEQWTMFFRDPSGNPIEVKGFASLEAAFDV